MGQKWSKAYKGRLCMVWAAENLPMPDMSAVTLLYDTLYRPALVRDSLRLHDAFVAGHAPRPRLGYDDYVNGICDFREATGTLSVADMPALESEFADLHNQYMTGLVNGMHTRCRALYQRWQHRSDAVENIDDRHLDRRFPALAADTGKALRDFAERFKNPTHMARLYALSMAGGPGAVKTHITTQWVNERRAADMQHLQERMFFATAERAMVARAAEIAAQPYAPARVRARDGEQVVVLYEKRGGVLCLTAA